MLRINLLPTYVTQRRLTKRLIFAFAALLILFTVLPLLGWVVLKGKLNTITQDAATAVAGKKVTDALRTQKTTTLASADVDRAKLQFVADVYAYNRSWVALYNTLADSTPKSSLLYTGAQVAATTMTINAYSPSVAEVGRYLTAMYQEPDFQTVTIDKVPGYPDNIQKRYYLDGVMVFADSATGGAAGGSSGYPGSSGRGGGYPGSSGGYPGSSGGGANAGGAAAAYTPQSLGPNAPGNVPDGVGPPPPELTGGVAANPGASNYSTSGGGYPGGQGGFPGGGGQAAGGGNYSPKFLQIAGKNISPFATDEIRQRIYQVALRRVVTKTIPKGFDVTVTATLKQPFTPPALPGTAPAAGAAGAAGTASPFGGPGGGGRPGSRPG